MTDILERRLKPSVDAAESPVGDETVILHLKDGIYYGLDSVGTRIWALLKEGAPIADICEQLSQEFGVDRGIIEADARRFLNDLHASGLVVEA